MKDNTSNQNEKCIEMFLEALSQVPNIFKGIREQDELPMTRRERKFLESELHNYWDYGYVLSGAYLDGFSFGMGIDPRKESLPKELRLKGKAIYDSLEPEATHPMTQEERNQFADKWLERSVFYATQKGALLHGLEEGKKYKQNLNIAKKMKDKGSPLDFIADITGLSIEEIEKL